MSFDPNDALREANRAINEAMAEQRDAMLEAHVAATLAAGIDNIRNATMAVDRYREVLAQLRKTGGIYQAAP